MKSNRRSFVVGAAALGMAGLVPAAAAAFAQDKDKKDKPEEEVGATEDLMREHGVLNRVLLIYEEGLRRLRAKEEVGAGGLPRSTATWCASSSRTTTRSWRRSSSSPSSRSRRSWSISSRSCCKQHQAGRAVTDVILRDAADDRSRKEDGRQELVRSVEAFIRMYRPHEAREDTVLFPALHKIVTPKQLKDLGEQFEKEEDRLFGDEGFEKTVDKVAAIEKQLGIYDLAQFTPKVPGK